MPDTLQTKEAKQQSSKVQAHKKMTARTRTAVATAAVLFFITFFIQFAQSNIIPASGNELTDWRFVCTKEASAVEGEIASFRQATASNRVSRELGSPYMRLQYTLPETETDRRLVLLTANNPIRVDVDGAVLREIPTGFSCPELDGKYFLVTGTGKYFKNVQYAPEINLGLVRLTDGGETAQPLWGFADGGKFTSEFPAHMMSHAARLKIDLQNRVVMHCHPANLLAMTYVHSLDEKAFTRTLWQMCTECIVVFPDGVNVLPWMLCGTNEIGEATAEKMRTARLVVWAQHGIYGAGKDLDETFGLIETAEKAAEIYMKIAHLPLVNTITDDQMHQLEAHFGVKAREGYLS